MPLFASLAAILAAATSIATGLLAETMAMPLLFAGLLMAVALTADNPANPLGWRPVHYLGEISYSTYLAHFLLFVLFKLLFVDDASNVPLPLLGLFLLMTLAASVLLFHLVERPAQRAVNRSFDDMLKRVRSLRFAG
jgi:peptidoglycan/LPS O-acetylase OafA/YrhL